MELEAVSASKCRTVHKVKAKNIFFQRGEGDNGTQSYERNFCLKKEQISLKFLDGALPQFIL